jgi:hypothetical protein
VVLDDHETPLEIQSGARRKLIVDLASDEDREVIYRMRHEVYARELAQHRLHPEGRLRDALDDFNQYIVVRRDRKVLGFISITPPEGNRYSIDKYLSRDQLPFSIGDDLYEVRILTVHLRELASVTSRLGPGAFRVAVKNAETNRRIVEKLGAVLREEAGATG